MQQSAAKPFWSEQTFWQPISNGSIQMELKEIFSISKLKPKLTSYKSTEVRPRNHEDIKAKTGSITELPGSMPKLVLKHKAEQNLSPDAKHGKWRTANQQVDICRAGHIAL